MKQSLVVGVFLFGLVAGAVLSLGHPPVAAQQLGSVAMEQKMDQAKKLLEGIALRDFDAVLSSAEALRKISIEAQWIEGGSALYGAHGQTFRQSLDGVTRQAEAENLEGVTLQYTQVVLACVQCHEDVRENQKVAFAPLEGIQLRSR